MARELVDDALCEMVQLLLPVKRRRNVHLGRKPLDNRWVLTGILFVLQLGVTWEMLSQNMRCSSSMTC